jgi:mannose-1-phosphate guanylyltransferase
MTKQVYAVILAGGSGSRFWPASRTQRPKQLQPLGPGDGTLIEQTVQRLLPICSAERMLIATGKHLVEATRKILPGLPETAMLAEPQARNTAPCIGWAAERVARIDPDAIVVVVPSDQYVAKPEAFTDALRRAIDVASTGVVVTLGIKPTRAETGYGYLHAGAAEAGVNELRAFKEKPNRKTAERYYQSGEYFWNAGIFVFPAGLMLEHFNVCLPKMGESLAALRAAAKQGADAEERAVADFFANAESISIDYGVMEKIGAKGQLKMVPADVGWSDLGSFQTAWELSEHDARGNAFVGDVEQVETSNSYVLDLRSGRTGLTALVGVEDLIVVHTDDATLVARRDRCQEVKQIVEALKAAGRTDLL